MAPASTASAAKSLLTLACSLYKQKLKGYYGNIGENNLKYYVEAVRRKGDTGQNLVDLECRLDAVLYRAKLVPTVFSAPTINHGHVLLNGKRCNIASVLLKPVMKSL